MRAPGDCLVVTAARMWDGRSDAVAAPGYVAVRAEQIVNAGEGLPPEAYAGWPVLALGDVTLLPAAIDAHVHLCLGGEPDPAARLSADNPHLTTLRAARRAYDTLLGGVVWARDCGGRDHGDIALREAIGMGLLPGARLQVAGRCIVMTGGHGHELGREADGADDCRRAAREQLKAGADFIKVMATGGVMTRGVEPGQAQLDLDELAAAVAEGRKAGRPAAAHAQGAIGVKQAVLAGVRSIEHGVYLTDETIELMLRRQTFLVPTFSAPRRIIEAGVAGGVPKYAVDKTEAVCEAHRASFDRAWRAGVKIAMGTDAGTPYNVHGQNLAEIGFMVDYGMPAAAAWRAATSGAAELLGIADRTGTLEAGRTANLLGVRGDALADASRLPSRVVWVMQEGTVCRDDDGPARRAKGGCCVE